jgi:diguanylate cyclase (GGDEF)-like protein
VVSSRSLPVTLVARIGAILVGASGLVSAMAHVVNPVGMDAGARAVITAACLGIAAVIWVLPWERLPSHALWGVAHAMIGLKVGANLLGGYGPYSYGVHFVLIAVWMGLALPRGSVLVSAPLFAGAYVLPMLVRPIGASIGSAVVVVPVCLMIGECIGWVADRLRRVDAAEGSQREELGWLLQAATRLAEDREPEDLVGLIAQLSLRAPGATGTAVLVEGRGRRFSLATSIAWTGRLPEALTIGDEPAFVAASQRRSMLLWSDPLCVALADRMGVASVSVIPLFGTRGCLGLVLVAGGPSAATDESGDIPRLLGETLAIQAGLALERQRMQAALREASLQDELTRLGNRRKAQMRLARLQPGESLMLLDLDHFKQVNDSAGHPRGDEILRQFARHLCDTLRHDDAIFRMGGEEFLVVLVAPREGAEIAAERLLESWRLREPETTFSIGVAEHREGTSVEETVARADRALYEAKEGGRDQARSAD